MVLTTLAHHIDFDWMQEAFRRTRKDGAPGVDGQTWDDYAANREENLRSLLDRAKSGTYWAPPVRRAHIPKAGKREEKRPIGIPTLEDKVLQRAVLMVLEPVFEADFLECSYGFRPGRSPHDALGALRTQMMEMGIRTVVEVDIRKCFDTLEHCHIQQFFRKRVRDGVLVRLIGKWLNAGVLEDAFLTYPESGSPQGGVISPMLMNIYLHEVLDLWFAEQVIPVMQGRCFLTRYADDFVMGFSDEEDARRVFDVLGKRFGKYGLTLHPDKTRLVPFRRPRSSRDAASDTKDDDGCGPGTFDFLGFTHHWALSRRGYWVIKQRTAKDRFARALRRIRTWCARSRHLSYDAQQAGLARKLRGHYQYYGITGNWRALHRFYGQVVRTWFYWLRRRAQKRHHHWQWFLALLEAYPLPGPVAVHSSCRLHEANP